MKRYIILVILLVFSSYVSHVTNAQDKAIYMPDENLREAVKAALNLNTDDSLTPQKMLKPERAKCEAPWNNRYHGFGICDAPQILVGWRKSD